MNAVVAPTAEEADRLALPQLLAMLALRTGQPLAAQQLVEEAEKVELPEPTGTWSTRCASRWVIGSPDEARARIGELAAAYDVDEVMVHPVAGRPRRDRAGRQPRPRGDPAAARRMS